MKMVIICIDLMDMPINEADSITPFSIKATG